ncbi:MAG: hypothetical protein A3B96_04045 [Candidatus Spechtbacteria bacterium RIFCSPHIGHO2_02_FULL_43_15b]|uniref:Uncharacterized protein n=1 Tax=Candidatus Spechtbacteria bacterium RIFCSPHIGHO2_01_FULL_43_30 TaxID=1802158 RepID=A0A1G2H7X9_9BACT|nr:MAG: hypothetical protein A2827_02010 [Candidatus Spechtbacteria bacterium RIFCSPHIGHO2_01_FULL_43_30]OGZ60392.1 MAG: hypothetical protein A3B96_04045 [Candidatus Spechtbacteria bacterium RIFCSPHIGHO2_02_FULL_43_15b]
MSAENHDRRQVQLEIDERLTASLRQKIRQRVELAIRNSIDPIAISDAEFHMQNPDASLEDLVTALLAFDPYSFPDWKTDI